MKTILPPIEEAAVLCAVQKEKAGARWRPTRHQIAVGCEAGTLLYHTLTGELLLLGPGEAPDEGALRRGYFLVPEDFDEKHFADDVRAVARLLRPRAKHVRAFTILTTTDCNARCFYCFEQGCRRESMTPGTARAAAACIARACGGKAVALHWFGGEPLYNRAAIETITGALRAAGVPFTSRMTSNGFYLDPETARHARDAWGLTEVQITLDGTRENYDRVKNYIDRDAQSPFERVMDNIGAALACGIEVRIPLNLDRANAADLFALTDELKRRFGDQKGLCAIVNPLHEIKGKIHAFDTPAEAAARCIALEEKLAALGLAYELPLKRALTLTACMADDDACEVIYPDGSTGRCEHPGEGAPTGSIFRAGRDAAVTQAWREHAVFPDCAACALYPQCIRARQCAHSRGGCGEADRRLRRLRLERAIRRAYRDQA